MLKIVPDPPALLDFLGHVGESAWPLRRRCRERQQLMALGPLMHFNQGD